MPLLKPCEQRLPKTFYFTSPTFVEHLEVKWRPHEILWILKNCLKAPMKLQFLLLDLFEITENWSQGGLCEISFFPSSTGPTMATGAMPWPCRLMLAPLPCCAGGQADPRRPGRPHLLRTSLTSPFLPLFPDRERLTFSLAVLRGADAVTVDSPRSGGPRDKPTPPTAPPHPLLPPHRKNRAGEAHSRRPRPRPLPCLGRAPRDRSLLF